MQSAIQERAGAKRERDAKSLGLNDTLSMVLSALGGFSSYGYPYTAPFPALPPQDGLYPDHGDGFGEYYGLGPLTEDLGTRPSRSKLRSRRNRPRSRTTSKSNSRSQSQDRSRERDRSRNRSRERDRSRDRERSRDRSRSRSRSRSHSGHKEVNFKEPGFLDAFRVLYLTPSKHKKNTAKYISTQKHRDRVQEYLKADRLGSKHWLFYPRNKHVDVAADKTKSRESCDQRVKVDGDFFRKYRKSKKVDTDAPIAKLKRWELVLYKKLGFVQAI